MQRRDAHRSETARTTKAETEATPGKQTLVESLRGGLHSGKQIGRLNEAAKGGTDANPKHGTGGGGDEEAGEMGAQAPGHDGDAVVDAGAGAAPGTTGAKQTGAVPGRPAGAPTSATAGPSATAGGAQAAAAGSASGELPGATSEAKSERTAKAEIGVTAVFGRSAGTATGQEPTASASHGTSGREAKEQAVKPTASPTFNGSAGSNDCLPGDATGASITWTVVAGATTWGVNVASFTTTGTINVAPWPSKPTEMVTPNTANAVDGGNIESKAGSNNDWKFAVKEMKEYHQAGGGRSSYWHSYEASKAHEWEHWNTDWLKGIVEPLWPAVNTDLDAITIPKADAADEATARPKLQAKIDARMKTFDRELTRKWNAVPDTPGQAGANGYIAGQKVLDTLIAAVEAYAKKKGW